jgi:hypothetical protein
MFPQGFPKHSFEKTVEMRLRKTGEIRQFPYVQILVQIFLNVLKHPEDAFLIVGSGRFPHGVSVLREPCFGLPNLYAAAVCWSGLLCFDRDKGKLWRSPDHISQFTLPATL